MQNFFFIFLLCLSFQGFSQDLRINVLPIFGNEIIREEKWFVSSNGDSMQFENVRFYLSNIQFVLQNGQIVKDNQKAHLVDVFEPNSLTFLIENIGDKAIKQMQFNIGIDSTASVSGALSGDLDPSKGMYWAWQSGYINMKIEGRSPVCKTRKNAFQFHIGGYMQPFYAMRQVVLPLNEHHTPDTLGQVEGFTLKINLSDFFKNIHLATQNSLMIPSKEAMQLADWSVNMFSIDAPKK